LPGGRRRRQDGPAAAPGADAAAGRAEALDVTGKDFTDDNGKIVEQFAATKGISAAEARKQLKAMRKAEHMAAKLERKYGDDFAGIEFDHSGGKLRVKVKKARASDKDKVDGKAAAQAEGIDYEVDTVNSALSKSATAKLEQQLLAALKGLDPEAGFSIDSETGNVIVYSDKPGLDTSALGFVPGTVEVKPGAKLVLTTNLVAGSAGTAPRRRATSFAPWASRQ
jgi:hypothetical protein